MPRRALLPSMLALGPLLLSGCGPAGTASAGAADGELRLLRAELAELRAENAQLRLTPGALAGEAEAAMGAGDAQAARQALQALASRHPASPETAEMRRRMAAFEETRRSQEDAARKLAALGLKALPVPGTLARADTSLALGSASLARRWTFDSWGEGWRYEDAEKDHRMLVARVTVSSRQREPQLFGLAAYVADGAKLRRVGEMRYRFARWNDYGAFLGTHADFRNDFAHSWRVPLTAAVALSEQDLQKRPLFIVATSEGCHQRSYERFGQPPVSYLPRPCASLKPELSPADFQSDGLAILKRLD